MNKSRIEEVGLQEIKNIHSMLGGWPVADGDKWNENSTFDWINSTQQISDAGFGLSYLFIISVDTDMKNSSRKRIMVWNYMLFLNDSSLLSIYYF